MYGKEASRLSALAVAGGAVQEGIEDAVGLPLVEVTPASVAGAWAYNTGKDLITSNTEQSGGTPSFAEANAARKHKRALSAAYSANPLRQEVDDYLWKNKPQAAIISDTIPTKNIRNQGPEWYKEDLKNKVNQKLFDSMMKNNIPSTEDTEKTKLEYASNLRNT